MIKLLNINKIYKSTEKSLEFQALFNINISVDKGEFITIYGKSGCGKTTLLNIIGCMDNATSGDYYFENNNVLNKKNNELSHFRNLHIGFVFQSFFLVDEMNSIENICLPMGYKGVNSKERKKRALELLERVGLKGKEKHKPKELSGGEQQRVAIARAIANTPKILIADEPTGNLDEKNSHEIMKLLTELNHSGTTIIMVTHDKNLSQYSNRTIYMSDGKVIS